MLSEHEIREHVQTIAREGADGANVAPHVSALLANFLINHQRQTTALQAIAQHLASLDAQHGAA